MNRAEAANLFALLRQMNAGQNDRARVGMTCAQVVKKILAEVGCCIDIENKKLGFHSEDKLLGFLQAARHFHQRIRHRFLKDIQNCGAQLFVRLQNQNPSALLFFLLHRSQIWKVSSFSTG